MFSKMVSNNRNIQLPLQSVHRFCPVWNRWRSGSSGEELWYKGDGWSQNDVCNNASDWSQNTRLHVCVIYGRDQLTIIYGIPVLVH